jgi:hypothetical protein
MQFLSRGKQLLNKINTGILAAKGAAAKRAGFYRPFFAGQKRGFVHSRVL